MGHPVIGEGQDLPQSLTADPHFFPVFIGPLKSEGLAGLDDLRPLHALAMGRAQASRGPEPLNGIPLMT